MKNKNQKLWFTFVELIVASTILILLSALWFYNYSKYITSTRDSERSSNIASISSSLTIYKQRRWTYPLPWDAFSLRNWSTTVAKQGKLNEKVALSTLDNLPFDPFLKIPYLYAITENKQEFQITATLENNNKPIALVGGNYKTVTKDILPSILIAYNWSGNIDISTTPYKNMFILNGTSHNLPYKGESKIPISDGTSFSNLINDVNIELWQNTDFKTCIEICNAGKNIGDGTYQIINFTGERVDINCVFATDCN